MSETKNHEITTAYKFYWLDQIVEYWRGWFDAGDQPDKYINNQQTYAIHQNTPDTGRKQPKAPSILVIPGYRGKGDRYLQSLAKAGFSASSILPSSEQAQARLADNAPPELGLFDTHQLQFQLIKRQLLQEKKPVIIMGVSLGSTLALALAADPALKNKIAGVVLVTPATGLVQGLEDQIWDKKSWLFKGVKKTFTLPTGVLTHIFGRTAPAFERDVIARLAAINPKLPITILAQKNDHTAKPEFAETLKVRLPQATLRWLLPHEQPQHDVNEEHLLDINRTITNMARALKIQQQQWRRILFATCACFTLSGSTLHTLPVTPQLTINPAADALALPTPVATSTPAKLCTSDGTEVNLGTDVTDGRFTFGDENNAFAIRDGAAIPLTLSARNELHQNRAAVVYATQVITAGVATAKAENGNQPFRPTTADLALVQQAIIRSGGLTACSS